MDEREGVVESAEAAFLLPTGPETPAGSGESEIDALAACLRRLLDVDARRFGGERFRPDLVRPQLDCFPERNSRGHAGATIGTSQHRRTAILAVSGGADSLALLLAASRLVETSDKALRFHVVTVDHGLRPAAAAEARYVEAVARRFGLTVETCRWDGAAEARGNLAAAARDARYGLLAEAAGRCGARLVLTGHHEDDQIETHLLAASRKAGAFGLAGMRPLVEMSPVLRLGRPFLGICGLRIKACVSAAGLASVDDPGNRDRRSQRVRFRSALHSGEIAREQCRDALERSRQARHVAEAAMASAIMGFETSGDLGFDEHGSARVTFGALREFGEEGAFHLLRRLIRAVGGGDTAPGGDATLRMLRRLEDGGETFAATLGGARVARSPWRRSVIAITREYGRNGPPPAVFADRDVVLFDRRFEIIRPDVLPPGAAVVPFGAIDHRKGPERTLPVIAAGKAVVAVPAMLASRVAVGTPRLLSNCRVRWRTLADLVGPDGTAM